MKWIYLLIAITSEVIGTTALKASEGFSKLIPSLLVIAGYSLAFYFMSLAIKEINVGIAYAIWSGVGIFFISLIGYFYYKQQLDLPAFIGIGFILFGILIINLFSKNVSQ